MESIINFLYEAIKWILNNIFYINILFAIVIIFFQRRDPQSVWTWILVLYFEPLKVFNLCEFFWFRMNVISFYNTCKFFIFYKKKIRVHG